MRTVVKTVACAIIAAIALFSAANAGAVIFTNLYSFSASSYNNPSLRGSYGGNTPQAALFLSGSTFFGTTTFGSSNGYGTIFAYSLNNGFTSLHTFTGSDGTYPQSDLIQSGNMLYGTTPTGGAYGGGTVFALNTNGTAFTTLFNFAYTNGGNPQAGLVLSGNTLYGTVSKGGVYGAGTIFAINTNGTGFTNFFNFNYTNGANPEADLLLLGNRLYGTTMNGGGSNGWGTVFAVNTNGTGFTNLYNFNYATGANPEAGLAQVSNLLCGTTANGGAYYSGTVFLIGTNGGSFSIVDNLASGINGYSPYSRLAVLTNSASSYSLFGTTEFGGNNGDGTIFLVNVSGSPLTLSSSNVIYNFGFGEGQFPVAGLVLFDNTLYGTTSLGQNIFSISTSGSNFRQLHSFLADGGYATNGDGADSLAGLVLSGNTLYGTASIGGVNGDGTVFAINTDGSGYNTLVNFNNSTYSPNAGLTISGNTLYGTTPHPDGSIFSLGLDGTGFTNFCQFSSTGDDYPLGNLVLSGGTIYGTTEIGINYALGAVFAVTTNGTGFTNLYNFSYSPSSGYEPAGGVVLNGNTLYGTTEYGDNNYGTVFAVNTDGSGFTNIFLFDGTNGAQPVANMILSGNTLYGVTRSDANRNCGTIFAINTDGSGFTNLYNFSGSDGMWPQGNLLLCGDTLYGTTTWGGSGGYGTVFSIKTDGSCFTTLYNFSGGNDGATPYDGLVLSGNTLYGTTSSGGPNGNGTVFALSLGAIPLTVQPDGGNVVLTWGNPVFSLQTAPAVNGPYVTVPGAASPYTNAINAAQKYFRLQE